MHYQEIIICYQHIYGVFQLTRQTEEAIRKHHQTEIEEVSLTQENSSALTEISTFKRTPAKKPDMQLNM